MRGLLPHPQRIQDDLQCRALIFQHNVVPKAQHAIATRLQEGGANSVSLFIIDMLAAVEFDDQLALKTTKICDIRANGKLTAKFNPPKPPVPQ